MCASLVPNNTIHPSHFACIHIADTWTYYWKMKMQNWPNQMCIPKTDALYLSKIWQFFSIHVQRMRAPSKKDWIEVKIESIIVIEKKTEAVHEFTQWLCAECIKSSLAHVPLWETIKKQHSLGSRAVSICSS